MRASESRFYLEGMDVGKQGLRMQEKKYKMKCEGRRAEYIKFNNGIRKKEQRGEAQTIMLMRNCCEAQ